MNARLMARKKAALCVKALARSNTCHTMRAHPDETTAGTLLRAARAKLGVDGSDDLEIAGAAPEAFAPDSGERRGGGQVGEGEGPQGPPWRCPPPGCPPAARPPSTRRSHASAGDDALAAAEYVGALHDSRQPGRWSVLSECSGKLRGGQVVGEPETVVRKRGATGQLPHARSRSIGRRPEQRRHPCCQLRCPPAKP